jgi:hypothetical protein
MHEPTPSRGALDRFALERLGEMLRGRYHLPPTLPSRVYDLVKKLDRHDRSMQQNLAAASKEGHHRRQDVDTDPTNPGLPTKPMAAGDRRDASAPGWP